MIKIKKIIVIVILLDLILVNFIVSNPITFGGDYERTFFKNEKYCKNCFDKYLNFILKICNLPSICACTIKNGEVTWANGYGYYDPETKNVSTKDTIYLVMSISKPVAATALMQLYEKDLFDLDDDLNDYLPFNLRNPHHPDDPITFRMILSHQSSLAPDEEEPMVYELAKTYCIGDPNISSYPHPWLENYLCPGGKNYTSNLWMDEKPGTHFHYANINYGLVEFLIEIISGNNFNEYCKQNIFMPLEMYNTSFLYSDLNTSRIAIPYNAERGLFIIQPLHRNPLYSYLWAACANLKTTVTDLSHFVIAHMNGGVYNDTRILNESTIDLMHTIQYNNIKYDEKYGLGFIISDKIFGKLKYGHEGGGPGVRTSFYICPSDNTSYIFFSSSWTWQLTILCPLHLKYMPLIPYSLLLKAKYS